MKQKNVISLSLLLLMSSCGPKQQLISIAVDINETTKAVGVLQSTVIDAYDGNLIDKPTADAVVTETVRVAHAIKQANATVRTLAAIPIESRGSLITILLPVIASIQSAADNPQISSISNETVRTAVRLGLQTILTALNSAKSILEASNAQ